MIFSVKKILVAHCFIFTFHNVFGQEISSSIEVGINHAISGYRSASIGKGDISFSPRFNLSFLFEKNIVPQFSLQSGLRFFQIGTDSKFGSITQNHLSTPLKSKYHIGATPFYVLGGIEFAFLIFVRERRQTETNTEKSFLSEESEDLTKSFNRFNLSVIGGLGLNFNLLSRNYYIQIHYGHSLTRVLDNWRIQEINLSIGHDF